MLRRPKICLIKSIKNMEAKRYGIISCSVRFMSDLCLLSKKKIFLQFFQVWFSFCSSFPYFVKYFVGFWVSQEFSVLEFRLVFHSLQKCRLQLHNNSLFCRQICYKKMCQEHEDTLLQNNKPKIFIVESSLYPSG